jgi:hypothetical protein
MQKKENLLLVRMTLPMNLIENRALLRISATNLVLQIESCISQACRRVERRSAAAVSQHALYPVRAGSYWFLNERNRRLMSRFQHDQ